MITYTYLIFDGKYYKIGKSQTPEKRLKTIKTYNPHCKLIMFFENPKEKELHQFFKDKKIGGEWFELNKNDIDLINKKIEDLKKQDYADYIDEELTFTATLAKIRQLNHYVKLAPLCEAIGLNVETLKARLKRGSPELSSQEAAAIVKVLDKIKHDFQASRGFFI